MLNTANEFTTIPTGAPPGWRAFDIGVSSRNLMNNPVRAFAVTDACNTTIEVRSPDPGIMITLQSRGNRLTLTIVDDGAGFDAEVETDGNGLVSMRRRAERLGANFDIQSRPGEGTTLRLEVPQHRVH
jgi:signal transduction histidine kinase